jgi:hypothetical protein
MNSIAVRVFIALVAVAALCAANSSKAQKPPVAVSPPLAAAVDKGAKWLASVQGADGGWGQDGGAASNTRQEERLESSGNDVANTAVAALALMRAGKQYQPNVERALAFILKRVEASPADGLAITNVQGTQIQRKLGPYIDTFLTSMLLAELDGTLSKVQNARIRQGLEKCVAKIERNQKGDGSWNIAGGWAPVLGTSMASRSLYAAQQKGVKVNEQTVALAENYTLKALDSSVDGVRSSPSAAKGSAGGIAGRAEASVVVSSIRPESAVSKRAGFGTAKPHG